MKVEIGAGARARDGFVALDVNPANADVIGDALHLPFADASIEELRAVDVLEHLSYRSTADALAEWSRVLRPGGRLYVQVPDAERIMLWFARNDARLERWEGGQRCTALHGAQWRLLGGHGDGKYVDADGDWRWNAHYAFFSADSLTTALLLADLTVESIESNGHPNLLAWASKR